MIGMMISVIPGIPPPMGNPFFLYPHRWIDLGNGIYRVDTGLTLHLPVKVMLKASSLVHGVAVFGAIHSQDGMNDSNELSVIMGGMESPMALGEILWHFRNGNPVQPFALGFLFDVEPTKVRFMEMGSEGGRIIKRDAAKTSGA